MKIRSLIILTGFLCVQAAQANILVKPSTFTGTDICSQLPGTWSGTGTVKKDGLFSCSYHGTAVITPGSSPNTFSMAVTLTKDSGICPNESITLPGSCDNGHITLTTNDANLQGNLNAGSANLSGTVSFTVPVINQRVTADTTINLKK